MLTQLFCSFRQRNVTGVPDPDRQKFQFLQAEHHPPPLLQRTAGERLGRGLFLRLLRAHFQLKKASGKPFVLLLAVSSRARRRWLPAMARPSPGAALPHARRLQACERHGPAPAANQSGAQAASSPQLLSARQKAEKHRRAR